MRAPAVRLLSGRDTHPIMAIDFHERNSLFRGTTEASKTKP